MTKPLKTGVCMGPHILLDKSVVQSLSFDDIDFLNRYYYLNIPSVLIMEIIGDLEKPSKKNESLKKQKVKYLANKISRQSSAFNINYRHLIAAELFGHKIAMDGRPVILGDRVVKEKSGERGIVIDVSPAEKIVNRWKDGDFTFQDTTMSKNWRNLTRSVDLERYKERLKSECEISNFPKNLEALSLFVHELLVDTDNQVLFLKKLVELVELNATLSQNIFLRWEQKGCPSLIDYAPYAYYCLQAELLFFWGLVCDLFSTRVTNLIDLQYLFYLPFCGVFSSSDKFQTSLAELCLKPEQEFIRGNDLKADLTEISLQCNGLDESQKADWLLKYGTYPPDNPSSVTSRLWSKFCPPQKNPKLHNSQTMTAERKAELLKRLKDFDEAVVVPDRQVSDDIYSDPDFVIRKREISIDDPCPCGSGKKLRDCHLDEIRASEEKDGEKGN
jgi:hypothetical protein